MIIREHALPITKHFASLLSEARQFATHVCIANQYLEQVSATVRASVLSSSTVLRCTHRRDFGIRRAG
jgi:hypothetical protein